MHFTQKWAGRLFGEVLMASQGTPPEKWLLSGQTWGIQGAPGLCGALSWAEAEARCPALKERALPPPLLLSCQAPPPCFPPLPWTQKPIPLFGLTPLPGMPFPPPLSVIYSSSLAWGKSPAPSLVLRHVPTPHLFPGWQSLGVGHTSWWKAAWGKKGGKFWILGSEGPAGPC